MQDDMAKSGMAGRLARLDDLDDYQVAEGEPDVRGWTVKTADGQNAGKVDSLIVDTTGMQVRYLEVELDKRALRLSEDRHVLVPLGSARLDDDNDDVLLEAMTATQLAALPSYKSGSAVTQVQSPPPRESDAKQFYGKRGGTGGVQRMTLSEEELKVGKRQRQAGEVDVRKTVETKHVSEKVPVMHEEITIERHAVSAGTAGSGEISEGEIRIPLMAEEAVVEKRTVAKEEIVIKKQMVQGEQTVEADLKKERLDVDRDVTRTAQRAASSAEHKAKGLGDRIVDKADDLKDRVDGNPASKPGRDETDRSAR